MNQRNQRNQQSRRPPAAPAGPSRSSQRPQPALPSSTAEAPRPIEPNTAPDADTSTWRGVRMTISGASEILIRPRSRTSTEAPSPGRWALSGPDRHSPMRSLRLRKPRRPRPPLMRISLPTRVTSMVGRPDAPCSTSTAMSVRSSAMTATRATAWRISTSGPVLAIAGAAMAATAAMTAEVTTGFMTGVPSPECVRKVRPV
jgi:hypothetical protein